jgi:phage recombination protein Bet
MATKYSMEPAAFEQTLRATVFPANGTREQFAAFLVVANGYGLNPLTKEIYAFPTKGGGLQPIVSIDGWCNLINGHPDMNGMEFDDHMDGDKVTAITCRIWRKGREHPTVVTEYLGECFRPTDPWKQYPRRMLRHKALIQCARYAFGFGGIVDPDEADRMGADASRMVDVTPEHRPVPVRPRPSSTVPPSPSQAKADPDMELVEAGRHPPGEIVWEDPPAPQPAPPMDRRARQAAAAAESQALVEKLVATIQAHDTATELQAYGNDLELAIVTLSKERQAAVRRALMDHLDMLINRAPSEEIPGV